MILARRPASQPHFLILSVRDMNLHATLGEESDTKTEGTIVTYNYTVYATRASKWPMVLMFQKSANKARRTKQITSPHEYGKVQYAESPGPGSSHITVASRIGLTRNRVLRP